MHKQQKVPCPYCGEMINKDAKACPVCGSDESTGWSDMTYLDGIDLSDDYDYDEIVGKEFNSAPKSTISYQRPWIFITAVILLILFLIIILQII